MKHLLLVVAEESWNPKSQQYSQAFLPAFDMDD